MRYAPKSANNDEVPGQRPNPTHLRISACTCPQVSVGGGSFLYAKRPGAAPFTPIKSSTRLGSLTKFFDLNAVGFVTNDVGSILSVVTKIDLLTHLTTLA